MSYIENQPMRVEEPRGNFKGVILICKREKFNDLMACIPQALDAYDADLVTSQIEGNVRFDSDHQEARIPLFYDTFSKLMEAMELKVSRHGGEPAWDRLFLVSQKWVNRFQG